jgi:hypothetical protein
MSSNNEQNPSNYDSNFDYNFKEAQLKSTATLTTVGLVCAIVSVFIGGALVSIVALICSAIAFNRMKKITQTSSAQATQPISTDTTYQQMLKRAKVAFVISIVALILNIISAIYISVLFYQIIASGDLSYLADAFYNSDFQSSFSSSSSVWS